MQHNQQHNDQFDSDEGRDQIREWLDKINVTLHAVGILVSLPYHLEPGELFNASR